MEPTIKEVRLAFWPRVTPLGFAFVFLAIAIAENYSVIAMAFSVAFSVLGVSLLRLPLAYVKITGTNALFFLHWRKRLAIPLDSILGYEVDKKWGTFNGLSYETRVKVTLEKGSINVTGLSKHQCIEKIDVHEDGSLASFVYKADFSD